MAKIDETHFRTVQFKDIQSDEVRFEAYTNAPTRFLQDCILICFTEIGKLMASDKEFKKGDYPIKQFIENKCQEYGFKIEITYYNLEVLYI